LKNRSTTAARFALNGVALAAACLWGTQALALGLGRQTVTKCMGGVRLADGTLAGSTLTMDQALRNLVSVGLTLASASARVSTLAARYLGLADRGELMPGAWADIVVLDAASLRLQQVIVEGEQIELGN